MAQQNRRERKKEETRDRILKAAFKLFVQNGFENTTIDQIADMADIGKGTFYNYFSSKEAALDGFIDELTAERGQQIWAGILELPDSRQRLKKSYQSISVWAEEYPELIRVYSLERLNEAMKNKANYQPNNNDLYFTEIIKLGQEAGDIRDDIDPLHLVSYLNAIFLIQVCKWLEGGGGPGLYELAIQGVDFFLIGALSTEKN